MVTTVSRACVQHGLVAVRPNFRGVGQSEGVFDKSVGETQDMLAVVTQMRELHPELADAPWVLAGFFVWHRGRGANLRGAGGCGRCQAAVRADVDGAGGEPVSVA